jgi:hypothetical protein
MKLKEDWTPGMWTSQQEAKAYARGYRVGVKRGKTIAINTCMALGRLTDQPKGYYLALSNVITNLINPNEF